MPAENSASVEFGDADPTNLSRGLSSDAHFENRLRSSHRSSAINAQRCQTAAPSLNMSAMQIDDSSSAAAASASSAHAGVAASPSPPPSAAAGGASALNFVPVVPPPAPQNVRVVDGRVMEKVDKPFMYGSAGPCNRCAHSNAQTSAGYSSRCRD